VRTLKIGEEAIERRSSLGGCGGGGAADGRFSEDEG
jgi:hypothetical protein